MGTRTLTCGGHLATPYQEFGVDRMRATRGDSAAFTMGTHVGHGGVCTQKARGHLRFAGGPDVATQEKPTGRPPSAPARADRTWLPQGKLQASSGASGPQVAAAGKTDLPAVADAGRVRPGCGKPIRCGQMRGPDVAPVRFGCVEVVDRVWPTCGIYAFRVRLFCVSVAYCMRSGPVLSAFRMWMARLFFLCSLKCFIDKCVILPVPKHQARSSSIKLRCIFYTYQAKQTDPYGH